MNALKHGMTAATPVLPGEDPDAFRHRLDTWTEALAPADAVEQFLVEQAATASWKIERADRVEAAHAVAALRDAEAEERRPRREHAARLGERLLGLPGAAVDAGPAPIGRQLPYPTAGAGAATAADGCDHPQRFIDRLESTAEGCAWLLERWTELREPLEQGTDWDEDQFIQAVQLSGRRPLEMTPEAWLDHQANRFFEDVEKRAGINREWRPEGEEDITERPDGRAEDCRKMGQQLVSDLLEDKAGARAALLGVVERASGRLTERAAANEGRMAAEAAEAAEATEQVLRSSFDASREGDQLRRYHLGCERSLCRTLETLLKLRREERAAGRAAGRQEGRGAAPPDAQDEAAAPVVAPSPPQDEATAPAIDQAVGRGSPDPAPALSVGRGSPDPAQSPTAGLPIHQDATTEPSAPPLGGGVGEPSAGAEVLRETCGRLNGRRPFGCPETRAEQSEVVDQTPVPDETAAPAVDQTPVPDEAAAALVSPSSPQDEATDQAVERTPVIDDATDPPLADRSSPQNEATAPARGAAREMSMVIVTALALLSSAGLAAAFGRSTDVTPRPSPISAHEPRDPRTAHPGGDRQGPGEIPPEGGTPAGREHRPCWSPAFRRSMGDDPTGHRAFTIRDRSDSPGGIANPVRIALRWQFSS